MKKRKTNMIEIYMKGVGEIKCDPDYDDKLSEFRQFENDNLSWKIWSRSRRKYIEYELKFIDRYFGTGKKLIAKYRDTLSGIRSYNLFNNVEDIPTYNYFTTKEMIAYDWMFSEKHPIENWLNDKDFII